MIEILSVIVIFGLMYALGSLLRFLHGIRIEIISKKEPKE